MRVLVCGGRTFHDRDFLFAELDRHNADWGPFKVLIQGGAGGADRLAKAWAEARGVECIQFPADWKAHGLAAGPIRNQQMIDEGKPNLVIAFPGGRGTQDMISKASKAKLQQIWVITGNGPQGRTTQPETTGSLAGTPDEAGTHQ